MIRQILIEDLQHEPISLQEAKDWMQMDYNDFDSLINMLIKSSREQSEKISGQAYGIKTFEIIGNEADEKVYPVQPFVEDVAFAQEDGVKRYRYKAGFVTLPMDLKVAVLQRIATGFAYRQNGVGEAVTKAINQSSAIELKYSYLMIR
jgi:hypothetical protein